MINNNFNKWNNRKQSLGETYLGRSTNVDLGLYSFLKPLLPRVHYVVTTANTPYNVSI